MKINELRPTLWTENLGETIDFYTNVLGFTCEEKNEDWGWASLTIDDFGIMISRPNAQASFDKIGFTGSFYFRTDDVETMWEKLKDKACICYGIETFDLGLREFAIFDNSGYTLQFGQEIAE